MIKRRFYKQEHGDKDAPSDSSSSSDSELDAEASVDSLEEEEEDDNNVVVESIKEEHPCSSSSGYESEDSSGNEVNLDSSDSLTNDDGSGDEDYKREVNGTQLPDENHSDMVNTKNTEADNDAMTSDVLDCVLKSKSVFKCRLCPRIMCLSEETLKAHLTSKRHARSVKLLKEGRLKKMLNSDGEIEEADGETHQERHAKTLALAESIKNAAQDLKKNKGRQRQKKRKILKKKTPDDVGPKSTKKSVKKTLDDVAPKSTKKSAKKRRKSDI